MLRMLVSVVVWWLVLATLFAMTIMIIYIVIFIYLLEAHSWG